MIMPGGADELRQHTKKPIHRERLFVETQEGRS